MQQDVPAIVPLEQSVTVRIIGIQGAYKEMTGRHLVVLLEFKSDDGTSMVFS